MSLLRCTYTCITTGLLAVLLAAAPRTAAAQNVDDLASWMSFVGDSIRLGELTIPGSHDSGAMVEPIAGTAKCQSLGIADQLAIGVRYLDIRLRQIGNALVVHHGSVYQNQNFDDVLGQVTGFLQAHPTEAVVMEVSSEYTPANNTESYEQSFLRYVDNPRYTAYWSRHAQIPTLGEVRGKIVLLRRFAGSAAGAGAGAGGIDVTGWQDNTQFTLSDAAGAHIVVQDNYNVAFGTNDNKWRAVATLLDQAVGDTGTGTWYLNFTSGVRSIIGIPNIPSVSNDINGRLLDRFSSSTQHHVHHGTVISDFVDQATIQQMLRRYFD